MFSDEVGRLLREHRMQSLGRLEAREHAELDGMVHRKNTITTTVGRPPKGA
jgi:hypothetical protein